MGKICWEKGISDGPPLKEKAAKVTETEKTDKGGIHPYRGRGGPLRQKTFPKDP